MKPQIKTSKLLFLKPENTVLVIFVAILGFLLFLNLCDLVSKLGELIGAFLAK